MGQLAGGYFDGLGTGVQPGARHRSMGQGATGAVQGLGHYFFAGAPSGTTFQNIAEKGSLLTDTTNAKLYINTGTLAAPTWTVVGAQV